MRSKLSIACAAAILFLSVFVRVGAQPPAAAQQPAPAQPPPQQPAPAQPPPGRAGGPGRGASTAFPKTTRPLADPAIIERGSALYGINCRLCHGADLRGGDLGGINLLRSQLVLADQDAELIHPVVIGGRNNPGMPPMPPIPLSLDDTKAIAAYIRSVLARSAGQGGPPPGPPIVLNIVVGDAAAGQKYFAANCASCHSPTGDLAGIASRYAEPMQLQNTWVSGAVAGGRGGRGVAPRTPKPVTAVVTTADGQRFEGPLQRIDDFIVVIADPDGIPRTFRRVGTNPKIDITDPLDGHKKLWVKLTDKDMHDVTAYLVTLK
jgi:cytochrome c oxidase cbb3-type subunit 3